MNVSYYFFFGNRASVAVGVALQLTELMFTNIISSLKAKAKLPINLHFLKRFLHVTQQSSLSFADPEKGTLTLTFSEK